MPKVFACKAVGATRVHGCMSLMPNNFCALTYVLREKEIRDIDEGESK